MKKGSLLKKGLVVLSLLSVVACTSTQPQGDGNQLGNIPAWTYNADSVTDSVAGVGSVKVGPAGVPIARNIALAQARTELGRSMEVKVSSLVKNYLNATGLAENQEAVGEFSQTSDQLSIELLKNSKQLNMYLTKDKDLYVLVGISKESIKAEAAAKLKAVTDKLRAEKKITTKLSASKAHEDLEKAKNSDWDKATVKADDNK